MNLDVLAGKMSFDGKRVSPDNRKGILRLVIDAVADSVVLQWLDRSVDPPVVENTWSTPVGIEEVPSVKTGKVYVIKPLGAEKQFVWIQQQPAGTLAGDAAGLPSPEVDNVEALMNQIQMFSQISSAAEAMEMYHQIFDDPMVVDLGPLDDIDDEEEDEDIEAIVEQLMDQVGEDASEDDVLRMLLANPQIMGACLVQYLQNLANMVPQLNPATTAPVTTVPVMSVITPSIFPHLLPAHAARLAALCPDADVEGILASPQFSESMRALTEGIYSDQLGALFASLGLPLPTAGEDPFEALCQALERKYRNSSDGNSSA